ncbi:hypothetical protein DLD82_04240 [Methanospirillum stamsii]|uniref:Uncharacterized protein n=1 Tax=Methanospirillum stamsii TaxID=1277351 RepID=A0A2V2NIA9_9EURY|nr:hypothetical protein DLD82_04240 [Methanospirillum stamsii]
MKVKKSYEKIKKGGRKCISCVAIPQDCGGLKKYWIKCSHLQYSPNYYFCAINKQNHTFHTLPDGTFQASSCPLDRGLKL